MFLLERANRLGAPNWVGSRASYRGVWESSPQSANALATPLA